MSAQLFPLPFSHLCQLTRRGAAVSFLVNDIDVNVWKNASFCESNDWLADRRGQAGIAGNRAAKERCQHLLNATRW